MRFAVVMVFCKVWGLRQLPGIWTSLFLTSLGGVIWKWDIGQISVVSILNYFHLFVLIVFFFFFIQERFLLGRFFIDTGRTSARLHRVRLTRRLSFFNLKILRRENLQLAIYIMNRINTLFPIHRISKPLYIIIELVRPALTPATSTFGPTI